MTNQHYIVSGIVGSQFSPKAIQLRNKPLL